MDLGIQVMELDGTCSVHLQCFQSFHLLFELYTVLGV